MLNKSKAKKITKRQSLILCIKLWKWLEKNARRIIKEYKLMDVVLAKDYWPGGDKFKKDFKTMVICSTCVYTQQNHNLNTTQDGVECYTVCMMRGLWPNGCCVDPSPYEEWDKNGMPRHAREIWQHAEKLLKRMKPLKKRKRNEI